MSLLNKDCVKTRAETPKLQDTEIKELLKETPCWTISHETKIPHLIREFEFSDFASSLEFVNQVGDIAEKQGHHPDIVFGWGYAIIQIFTHKIKGLVESDFILAAKINKINF